MNGRNERPNECKANDRKHKCNVTKYSNVQTDVPAKNKNINK